MIDVRWPRYTFTSSIVRDLMAIEAARQMVRLTTLPPALAERLRTQARLRSTHFSTRIEGNRLTLAEAQAAVVALNDYTRQACGFTLVDN